MVLKQSLKMPQLVRILFFRSDDVVYDQPVFFDKITLVNIVCDEREAGHEFVNQWTFKLSKVQYYVSTCGPH